jgi:four helix bundle protein
VPDRVDIVERTFRFAVEVVRFNRTLCRHLGQERAIANQMLRSATSIGANVEEAQAALSRKDFINTYSIALKDARETRYWLRLIHTAELFQAEPLPKLMQESMELCNILGAIVSRTKRNSDPQR